MVLADPVDPEDPFVLLQPVAQDAVDIDRPPDLLAFDLGNHVARFDPEEFAGAAGFDRGDNSARCFFAKFEFAAHGIGDRQKHDVKRAGDIGFGQAAFCGGRVRDQEENCGQKRQQWGSHNQRKAGNQHVMVLDWGGMRPPETYWQTF